MPRKKKRHLLMLPAELRNRIYDLAFTNTTVNINSSKTHAPGLLLACRQTHAEAFGAYWRNSNFESVYHWRICDFLKSLDSTKVALITTITCDKDRADPNYVGRVQSAHDAQRELFAMHKWLAEDGVVLSSVDVIKMTFRSAANDLLTSATPWRTMADLLENCGVTGSLVEEYSTESFLRHAVRDQSRFFEYEHRSDRLCWSFLWLGSNFTCGCPKKMLETGE